MSLSQPEQNNPEETEMIPNATSPISKLFSDGKVDNIGVEFENLLIDFVSEDNPEIKADLWIHIHNAEEAARRYDRLNKTTFTSKLSKKKAEILDNKDQISGINLRRRAS